MTFKDKLQERIERNTVKIPNVTWTDNSGNIHTEDIVLKRSKLPLIGDWKRIYPPLDEDGKVNWINAFFGGKPNFIATIFTMAIIGLFFLGYYDVFNSYEALKNLCDPLLVKINP